MPHVMADTKAHETRTISVVGRRGELTSKMILQIRCTLMAMYNHTEEYGLALERMQYGASLSLSYRVHARH